MVASNQSEFSLDTSIQFNSGSIPNLWIVLKIQNPFSSFSKKKDKLNPMDLKHILR